MNNINKKFDERFGENAEEKHVLNQSLEPIKQFYQEEIENLIQEMVGERKKFLRNWHPDYIEGSNYEIEGYNNKRQEIINIAKKYDINIK